MARKAVDVSARRRVQAAGPVSVASGRIAVLDAFRGSAVIAMIAYHFCFDLRYFRLARFDFEHDAFWLGARAVILSSFLFAAGISVALALHRDPSGRRYWRHVAIIAASALAVSVASYVMFPRTYICALRSPSALPCSSRASPCRIRRSIRAHLGGSDS